MLFGALAGALGYMIAKRLQNEVVDGRTALCWGAVGAGVAQIPDAAEPPTSPKHRAFAHSLTTAGMVAVAAKNAYENPALSNEQKAAAYSIAAAYLSHLLLDAETPAGISIF